jgi:hypothetical protein
MAQICRYTIWKGEGYCATEYWRNDMCIFGMEQLADMMYVPYLFANKFQPDKDFGEFLRGLGGTLAAMYIRKTHSYDI